MPGNAQGSGFVSLQQYLNANQPAVDATAKGLVDDTQRATTKATAEGDQVGRDAVDGYTKYGEKYDPTNSSGFGQAQTDLQNAADQARGLGSEGGLQDQLTRRVTAQGEAQQGAKFGADPNTPAYTTGDARFDAGLVSGQVKGAAAGRFGGLDDYLSNGLGQAKQTGIAAWQHNQPNPAAGDYNSATVGTPGMGGPGNTSRPGGPFYRAPPAPPPPAPYHANPDNAGDLRPTPPEPGDPGYHPPKNKREGSTGL